MTADSQRRPRAATARRQTRAVAISPSVRSSRRSSTRRSPGLAAGAVSAATVQPAGREIVKRQIDAVEIAVVVGAVLQVVQHLQRGAQRVRSRPGVAALAVQVEQLAADRRGRIAAILHQIVPVAVAQLDRILAKRVQHVMAMLRGDAGLPRRLARIAAAAGEFVIRGAPSSTAAMRSSRRDLVVRRSAPGCRRCRRRCGRSGKTRAHAPAGRGGSATSRPGNSRRRDPCRTAPRRVAASGAASGSAVLIAYSRWP